MTDDIVARLRTEAFFDDDLCTEAADEIERLRAALAKYLGDCDGSCCEERFHFRSTCGNIARAALAGETADD